MEQDSLLAKMAGEKLSSFLNSPSSCPEQLMGTNIKGFWELSGICRAVRGRAWKGQYNVAGGHWRYLSAELYCPGNRSKLQPLTS